MSALKERLFDLEEGFWHGDAEFYRLNADANCLVNFPGMVDILDNEALAHSVSSDERWRDVSFSNGKCFTPTANVAVLAYEATARKGEGALERASVTSGYVERDGKWKLAWHHHTPLT